MQYSKGTCDGRNARYNHCSAPNVYIACKSRGQCKRCSDAHKNAQKTQKPKEYRKKPTGELSVFLDIWKTRKHVSQVSADPIPYFNVSCFMHILSKGAFPSFRLDARNIHLVTAEEHDAYDNGDRGKLKQQPEWAAVFEIKERLTAEYYSK